MSWPENKQARESQIRASDNERLPDDKRDPEILTAREARWLTDYAKVEHEKGRVAIAKILRRIGPEGDIRGTEEKLAKIWKGSHIHEGPYDWRNG